MGYDMYLVKKVECPDEAAAEVEWDAALAARAPLQRPDFGPIAECQEKGIDPFDATTWPDSEYKTAQVRVDAAMERKFKADLNYFRLNIWGMSHAREIMERLGMLVDTERPASLRWPDWDYEANAHEPYDCEDDFCPEYDGPDPLTAMSCVQWRKQQDQMLRWTPLEEQGILYGKLCSNDGWIVLPSEIKEALDAYAKHSYEDRKAIEAEYRWWGDWLEFLRRAANEGEGFKVH